MALVSHVNFAEPSCPFIWHLKARLYVMLFYHGVCSGRKTGKAPYYSDFGGGVLLSCPTFEAVPAQVKTGTKAKSVHGGFQLICLD